MNDKELLKLGQLFFARNQVVKEINSYFDKLPDNDRFNQFRDKLIEFISHLLVVIYKR